MTDEPQPAKYRKHDDLDRQHEIALNPLGFVPHKNLDWPTPSSTYLVRLMGKVSEHMACNHPGDPELYDRIVPELSRLGRKLPKALTDADVYGFLQTMTIEAMKLVERWQAVEPFIESTKPNPTTKAGRPMKRRSKQPSPWVDAVRRRVDNEHRREIADELTAS